MAKSVRASVQKRNKAKLRSTVFGPAVDARTARLSAKLQELASQPKPSHENPKSDLETTQMDTQDENVKTNQQTNNEAMDVDSSKPSGKSRRSQGSAGIKKQRRKDRSSIVFKPRSSRNKTTQRKK